MSLRVISIAKNATLQDSGRFGYRHYGVPSAGPFDAVSAQVSNIAVGNDPGGAVVELHAPGATFEALSDCRIAFYGATVDVKTDGKLLSETRVSRLKTGNRIEFSSFRIGARLYIAIAGGFEAEEILGSTCGTLVSPGDVLQSANHPVSELVFPYWEIETSIRIPLIPSDFTGFDFHRLPKLTVSHLSDRKGVRLIGDVPSHDLRQRSRPICPGAVQWTPSGELIVIGPDGPTIGGYPWIGTVPHLALCRLGQATMNEKVELKLTSWEQVAAEQNKIGPGWNLMDIRGKLS